MKTRFRRASSTSDQFSAKAQLSGNPTYQDLAQLAAPIHFFSIDVIHCLRL
jgi:hypothetical protein